jgi:MFS family permease
MFLVKILLKLFVYILPAVSNFVLGGMFFITATRFSQAGVNSFIVGGALAAWALVYSIVSFLVSKIVNEKNAAILVEIAGILFFAGAIGFMVFDGLYTQFLWIFVTSVASGIYCAPFQVFMKYLEPDKNEGSVRSAAFYTASWSCGLATGPLVFGLFSPVICFSLNAAVGLFLTIGIYFVAKIKETKPEFFDNNCHEVVKVEELNAVDYSKYPDLAKVGWIACGLGTFTATIVRAMEPFRAEYLKLGKLESAIALALVSYVLGTVGLSFFKSKTWMYKPLPILLAGIIGVAGLCTFAFGTTSLAFYIAAICYGFYSAVFYFLFVFYSIVHPVNAARNASVNEVVVGLSGTLGPAFGGLCALGTGTLSFGIAAALVIIATIVHTLSLIKIKGTIAQLEK